MLRTEAAGSGDSFLGRMMAARFGAAHFGLHNHVEFGLDWLDAETVSEWAGERFTRENVVGWMTGPPPSGLGLELPAGRRIRPPDPESLPELELPSYVSGGSGGVAVSLLARRSTAISMAMAVASERAHELLRRERGLTYDVSGERIPLTRELGHYTLGADCLDEHAGRVRDGLVEILDGLASEGPSEQELDLERTRAMSAIPDPENTPYYLDALASGVLLGQEPLWKEDLIRERAEVTSPSAATALGEVMDSLMLFVPSGSARPSQRFKPYLEETDRAVEGRSYSPRLSRPRMRMQGNRLIVGPEGVSRIIRDGEVVTIRFDQCVAVHREILGALTLQGRNGAWLRLSGVDFPDHHTVVASVEEAVPAERFVPLSERAMQVDEAARAKLKRLWTIDEELFWLSESLGDGETLLTLAEAGRARGSLGLLACTDRRVIFLYKVGGKEDSLEIPYARISSVRSGGPLRATRVDIEGEDGRRRFDVSPAGRAAEFVECIQRGIEQP